MSFSQYSPTHRQWDHVGNLIPNFEHSEGIRPAMYGMPAPWLPVQWQDTWFEVWIVVSAGKIVAMTTDGYLAPAGLRVDWAAAGGSDTVLTYTADDVTEKTIDLTTGVVVTAAVAYTKTQVQTALRSRGLIGNSETPDAYISYPVGVAAQAYYSWASFVADGFNPADLKFHNFRMQHQVQILCDYVLRLPWLSSAETTETMDATLTDSTPTFGAANLYSAARTKTVVRYSALTGANFIAWFSSKFPIAKCTARTPVSADDATLLLRLRSGPDALTQAGDYWIDYDAGVFFFYVLGGASVPASVSGTILTYNEYTTVPTAVGRYVSAAGNLKPGRFVECDADSNFTYSTSTDPRVLMGQVLGFVEYPKDYLDKVKTRYLGLGTLNQMPGTATAGYPDSLNASQTGADTEVIINLITR